MINKVMFFLPTLGGGGAERTIIQLANSFDEYGLPVDLIVCDISGEKSKLLPEVSKNINLINLDCGRVSNALFPLKKIIKSQNYDSIVSTQTHANIICVIAHKMAKSDSKIMLREVSTPSKNIKNEGLSKLFLKIIVNLSYRMADQIVCVSKGVLDDFRQYYSYTRSNLTCIYNPVIDKAYFEKLQAPVFHKFFDSKNKIIMAVGRLTEAKNFSFLIKSFYQLYQSNNEIRLIILGEGELRNELEKIIKDLSLQDVVDLPGFDSNPYAYFKYVDLFVLSSNWEGLPGVLIQALVSKVKVVSTNCPSGPMEILDNSKFGLLVECNDQLAMVTAMHRAIYGGYVQYNENEFIAHCNQFYKETVQQRYLALVEQMP